MSIFTATKEASYRKRLGYHSTLLAGICCMVATFILMGHMSTRSDIEEAIKQDELAMLAEVLPMSLYDNDLLADKLTVTDHLDSTDTRQVYVAKQDDKITGFALPAIGNGYSGDINLIVGIGAKGEVIGVRVISHAETPGLGDKIEIAKDSWILVFNGKSLNNTAEHNWAVKKDGGEIDQFSGATITPRAVVNAVHKCLNFFMQNQAQLVLASINETKPEDDSKTSSQKTSEVPNESI